MNNNALNVFSQTLFYLPVSVREVSFALQCVLSNRNISRDEKILVISTNWNPGIGHQTF